MIEEVEIYIVREGERILFYPSLSEIFEILKELGETEFAFTAYCG